MKRIVGAVVGAAVAAGAVALVLREPPPMVNPMPAVCLSRDGGPPMPCPKQTR